jgi:16S rRNA (cytidine1402-2'-O)-methyltransferase
MSGVLTLIPTPIGDDLRLHPSAKELLERAIEDSKSIFCVEDHKPARRRWIAFGLPRETIEKFVLYNEHTRETQAFELIKKLQAGHNVYLMSDCGLPAYCDPGQKLVDLCHEHNIVVSSTNFDNSPILALALSGYNHDSFVFLGFPPQKKEERSTWFKNNLKIKGTLVLMDTPYRLKATFENLNDLNPNLNVCLCLDLNKGNEFIKRGPLSKFTENEIHQKRDFILVINNE